MDLCRIQITHTLAFLQPNPGPPHTTEASCSRPGAGAGRSAPNARREEKQLTGMCLGVPFPLYQKRSG